MATYNYFIIPRIFGIFMLLIAFFNYNSVGFSFYTILSIIVGLLFLIWRSKDLQNNFNEFISSFSKLQKIVFVAFYDILFLLVTYISILLLSPLFNSLKSTIAELIKNANLVPTPETTAIVNELSKKLLTQGFVVGLIVLIVLFIIYTLFKSLIWSAILDKKINKQTVIKFFKVNSIWWFLFLAISLTLLFISIKDFVPYIGIFFIIVYIHFSTPLFYYTLTKDKVKEVYSNSILTTTVNTYHLLISYCFAIIIMFIISYPFTTQFLINLSDKTSQLISVVFVTFYFAWYNIFVSEVLKRIKN